MSNCPCGGVIFADTENWATPLCCECYTDLLYLLRKAKVRLKALEAQNKRYHAALTKIGILGERHSEGIAREALKDE